jgi:ABC-2 type transport system permease protein
MMDRKDLSQAWTVAVYEIRKYLRGRRLLGMLVLVALIVGLLLALPPLLGSAYPSTPDDFVATFAEFSGILIVLSGALFAADALNSEHDKRTGYFLFPNPVRRETIVVGKFLASLAASGFIVVLYYAAASISAWAITGSLTVDIALSAIYALAYMVCVVGVAFLLSSVLRGTVTSTVLTFFLFTLVFDLIEVFLRRASVSPWFLPSAASGIIGDVLAPPTPLPGPGGRLTLGFVPDVPTSLAVFAAYFVVSAVVAILLFRRKELKS